MSNEQDSAVPPVKELGWWETRWRALCAWWWRLRANGANRSPFTRSSSERHTGEDDVQLPSAIEFVSFQVRLGVIWCRRSRSHPQANDFALAIETLVNAAEPVAAMTSPLDSARLERRLRIEFGEAKRAGDTDLWVYADWLSVSVLPADLDDATAYVEVQRAKNRKEIEREMELSDIAHLKEKILVDTGQATMWWLVRQDYQIDLVRRQGPMLEQLVRTAQGYGDEHWADALIDRALQDISVTDMGARHDAILDVCSTFKARGQADEALELLRRAQLRVPSLAAIVDTEDRRRDMRSSESVA